MDTDTLMIINTIFSGIMAMAWKANDGLNFVIKVAILAIFVFNLMAVV